MKINFKILSLVLILTVALFSCNKDETEYIDPMIKGISNKVAEAAADLTSGSWNGALVGLRDQRMKLLNMKALIAAGKYSGDEYSLKDPDQATLAVNDALQIVEFKIDSIWNAKVQGPFDAIDTNSAGIVNLGGTAYHEANSALAEAYAWIMEESEDATEVEYIANDLVDLQSEVDLLTGLAALDEDDVIEYVNNIKAKFAEMKQQYADLAGEVSLSPYFSKAQKELYTSLQEPLNGMETTIEGQITLGTLGELNLIDRDLSALVYFVANNYTSPAQKPLVFGEISSITELRWLSEVATQEETTNDWVLTVDIDAAETHRWNPEADGPGFQQIQNFNGTFDGQYHIISGLFMTKWGDPGNNRSGIFHNITGAILNLGFVNLTLDAPSTSGGQGGTLFGMMTNGSVINCFGHGVMQLNSQSGGFLGRTGGSIKVENCFSAVDTNQDGAQGGGATNTSSFIGLPVGGPFTLTNCYNIGKSVTRAIVGFGAGWNLAVASGIYYDPETVGVTELENNGAYAGNTSVKLSDDGVVTSLPTADWGSLANFPEFSPDVWVIKTVPEIDANPRPYLKGFNYDGLIDFLVPDN